MVATRSSMTLEDYLTYDDGTDTRYELVDGVLVAVPPESALNTQIAAFLLAVFLQLGIPHTRLGLRHQIAVAGARATAREPDLLAALGRVCCCDQGSGTGVADSRYATPCSGH